MERRNRGWSRPGTLLLVTLGAVMIVLLTAANGSWSRWVTPAIWTAGLAWFFLLAPLGPYAGRRLVLTNAGWVEEPQRVPAPS